MNQAQKHLILCVWLAMAMLLGASAQNAAALTTKTLVVVGDGNAGGAATTGDYDGYLISIINQLKTGPVKISFTAARYQAIDTTKALQLNTADAIVILRNAVSSAYDDPIGLGTPVNSYTQDEVPFWAGIPKPMLMFSSFFARTNGALTGADPRWNWANSNSTGNVGTDNFDRIKVQPGHTTDTLFNGVTVDANSEVVIYSVQNQRLRGVMTGWLAANNGVFVASATATGGTGAANTDAPTIVRWTNTTQPFHTNTTITPGARRLFLGIFDDNNRVPAGAPYGGTTPWLDQYSLLTADGRRLLQNALNEVLPGYFAPTPAPNEAQSWTMFQ